MGIIGVIIFYCDRYSDFGFGKAMIQRKDVSDYHYASYFTFNLLVSIAFFVGAQMIADWLSRFYQIVDLESAIQVASVLFLITSIGAPSKSKIQRDLDYKQLAIIEGMKVGLSMATSLSFALNGFGFWSLIYAMLVSNVFSVLAMLYVTRYIPRISTDFRPLGELVHFGLWDFLGSQVQLIIDSADKLIIGKLLGVDALGFYDKAKGLARMPDDQLSSKLSQVSFSSFSRAQEDHLRLEYDFLKVEVLNATLVLPVLIGLAWVSESFVRFLLGDKWLPAVSSLQVLAIAFILKSLVNPVVSINSAIGAVKYQTIIRIVLTIMLITGLLLASSHGIEYASLTYCMFNLLMFIASYMLLNANLDIGWMKLIKSLMPSVTIAAGMLASLFVFDYIYDYVLDLDSVGLKLLFEIIIGGSSYVLLILLIPFNSLTFLRRRVLRRLGFVSVSP
jgi:O-antigen/teichoic acid export membrane protein